MHDMKALSPSMQRLMPRYSSFKSLGQIWRSELRVSKILVRTEKSGHKEYPCLIYGSLFLVILSSNFMIFHTHV